MLKKMVERRIRETLERLPNKYQWTLHNVLGHPLMEVLQLAGLESQATWVHRVTAPMDISYENVPLNHTQLF